MRFSVSTAGQVVQLREWLQFPDGAQAGARRGRALGSGFAALDAALPWDGWPRGALTEILVPEMAGAELALLLPALQRHWSALVAPPCIPYPPALARHGLNLEQLWVIKGQTVNEQLWAFEELLKNGAFRAVVAWDLPVNPGQSRRLQLAAESGSCGGFLIRPLACRQQISTAALRLQVAPRTDGLHIDIFKCRGQLRHRQVQLDRTELVP